MILEIDRTCSAFLSTNIYVLITVYSVSVLCMLTLHYYGHWLNLVIRTLYKKRLKKPWTLENSRLETTGGGWIMYTENFLPTKKNSILGSDTLWWRWKLLTGFSFLARYCFEDTCRPTRNMFSHLYYLYYPIITQLLP